MTQRKNTHRDLTTPCLNSSASQYAVDRNGSKKFRKDLFVKGAKRRLRRSKTLDKQILSKHTAAIAIDGFLWSTKIEAICLESA
jgi:hypothetical protein